MPISGKEMLERYKSKGWLVISQKGSHVKVRKGSRTEIIPLHKELGKGLEIKLLKELEE